jgi:hypothetical protein
MRRFSGGGGDRVLDGLRARISSITIIAAVPPRAEAFFASHPPGAAERRSSSAGRNRIFYTNLGHEPATWEPRDPANSDYSG